MKIYVVYHEPTAQNLIAFTSAEIAHAWIARKERNGEYQAATLYMDEIDLTNENID